MGWVESVVICVPLSGLLWALPGKAWMAFQVPIMMGQEVVRSPVTPSESNLAISVSPPIAQVKAATYPTFDSQQFDQQLQRYLRYLSISGPPDILIVGSSRAVQGVDPVRLQQTLVERGYQDIKVFNFGINGATAQVIELLLHQILAPDQLPRMVIWADGSRAFNSGRIDLTYRNLIASPGYKLLASGTRPVLPQTQIAQVGQLCMDMPTAAPTENSVKTAKSRTLAPGLQSIPLQLCGQPLTQPHSAAITVAPLHEMLGFRAIATRFNPAAYFRRYPRVAGNADADYRRFTLQGNQTRAFQRIVNLAKARQMPIVFVYLPLTQTYLDGVRRNYERQFRQFMQRYARSNQIAFYDFNQRSLSRDEYFADPSHLNRYGAAAIAAEIGRFLRPPVAQSTVSVDGVRTQPANP